MAKENDNVSVQMRKGMLEYCVLLIINREKSYASDIIVMLQKVHLAVVEGTVYTLLNRLKREGKLEYAWEESPKGPPRKYYTITTSGREALAEMSRVWDELSRTVDSLRRKTMSDD